MLHFVRNDRITRECQSHADSRVTLVLWLIVYSTDRLRGTLV